ncbi:hypothetical protein FA13DRAFT_1791500 [Coprinellus micaceus]|uniref:Uncharacterized protein n=1 Tax=Coprinellus micaceus TaxID=71717 RepID=A0A4Y7TAK5_COPMI|nr:hypothetical protein FA13DRAFT_1791500 [Coprinellus micaceus]
MAIVGECGSSPDSFEQPAPCVEAGWSVFLGTVAQTRVLRPRLQLPTTTDDLDDLACRCRPWLSIDLA